MEALSALVLIVLSNASPVVVALVLGPRWAWPLDAGLIASDGQPLFGPSKTVRGVIAGSGVPVLLAQSLGVDVGVGLAIGLGAMLGDLLTSFTKRRLERPPSDRVLILDQIPESLVPALAAAQPLGLSLGRILGIVLGFFVLELLLSHLLSRPSIRGRPH